MHTAFRTGGLDPDKNPRLAAALKTAKEAGVPKANIESAFARVSRSWSSPGTWPDAKRALGLTLSIWPRSATLTPWTAS